MSEMTTTVPGRDLATVTTEIQFYKRQTEIALLAGAIEIGRRLVEAKAMIGHGNWGSYLKNEVDFSQSTANNMMRLYEEYGTGQVSIFGNPQSIMNLDPTKALKLLAIPAEERGSFAAEHDVENKSVRELEKLIRERDEALKQLDDAGGKIQASEKELNEAHQTIDKQAQNIEALEQAAADKKSEVAKLEEALKKATEQAEASQQEIEQLKKNPSVPQSTMEQIRREAESAVAADTAQKTAKRFETKLAKAEKELKAANEALAEARQQAKLEKETAEAALKQLKLASPKAIEFKTLFTQAQDSFNKLIGVYTEITMEDPDLAANLKTAIITMLDQQKRYMEE